MFHQTTERWARLRIAAVPLLGYPEGGFRVGLAGARSGQISHLEYRTLDGVGPSTPEPSATVLIGFSLLGILALRRRS